jgi:hypothetical protein
MPNSIGPTGITITTQTEQVTNLTAALQSIYGASINLASNTPDGQLMNDFIQAVIDLANLLLQINNMFDPDNAVGVILDQRVAINGIQRQAGTYTVTNVTITVSQALNLYGLNQSTQPIFTVADNAGNQWRLQTTQNFSGPGTYVFSFQAANPGAVLTTINTITVPVSIVLGVTSINNPTTYTTLGINEETDAALKIRRQQSVSLASQGYLSGLLAALQNINGITSAFVYENTSASPNSDGVPGHSIWVIVAGTAPASAIANAIYTKRNAGCGMFGGTSYVITQVDGSSFIVYWDTVVPQTLFTTFTATSINGINPPNIAAILSQLPTLFAPGVFGEVNINQLATLVQQIDPNTLVTSAGFGLSATGPFSQTLSPSSKKNQFTVQASNIIITPMLLSPPSATVVHLTTQQFAGLGGYGTLTYSLSVNNSGGSINSSTGLYTAGATPGGTDTVRVVDSLGNSATALVTVT